MNHSYNPMGMQLNINPGYNNNHNHNRDTQYGMNPGYNTQYSVNPGYDPSNMRPSGLSAQYKDQNLNNITNEQLNRNTIDSVLQSINNVGNDDQQSYNRDDAVLKSLAKDREVDTCIKMLGQITTLKKSLSNSGVNVSNIQDVSITDSPATIEAVLRHLLNLSNQNRGQELAEELILSVCQGLGTVLNGRRKVLGYKPNARTWYKTVAVKLRNLRHDTSMIVSDVMSEYNMGARSRVMLELIPSFIYHVLSHVGDDDGNDNSMTGEKISESEYSSCLGKLRDIDQ